LQAFALSSAVYLFLQKQQSGYSALFFANHSVLGLTIINFAFLLWWVPVVLWPHPFLP
jgi:hypothetical protein